MALVPFSVSGAAASQDLEERLMQVGPCSLLLRQRPGASGNTAHLKHESGSRQGGVSQEAAASSVQQQQPDLSHVGLVLWQSGYVLADFLLLRLAAAGGTLGSSRGGFADNSSGCWAGVRVLELGCGGGTVGMFLALAGAQVVLTDQAHILPLTRENLAINFPATATSSSSSSSRQRHAGTAGSCCGQLAQQAPAAATKHPSLDAAAAGTVTAMSDVGVQQQQQHLSAAAAFAAVFRSSTDSRQTPVAGDRPSQTSNEPQQQQQQHCSDSTNMYLGSRVYGPGPVIVEYNWGEPLQQLQDRVSAAAGARLGSCGTNGSAAPTTSSQAMQQERIEGASQQIASAGQASAEAAGIAELQQGAMPGTAASANQANVGSRCTCHSAAPKYMEHDLQQLARQGFDVVIGADLLYDITHHAALLQSLQQLTAASPHLQVFLCWRDRLLGEGAFLDAAAAAGWVIEEVPVKMLHPEFQTGYYKLVRMVHLP